MKTPTKSGAGNSSGGESPQMEICSQPYAARQRIVGRERVQDGEKASQIRVQ
jgi:hypothetical protein